MGIQFAYFGNINTKQFVVTKAGRPVPAGLVAADRAVRFPREDNIESGSAKDLGLVGRRKFRTPPGFMAFTL